MRASPSKRSNQPRADPSLPGQVAALVAALRARSPQSSDELSRATSARHWGPGCFRDAVRSAVASGRISPVGRERFALTERAGAAMPGGALMREVGGPP